MMARRLIVLAAASLFVDAAGCHPAVRPPSTSIAADSLVGIVSITGTAFEQQLVIRSNDGTTRLSASAADSAALSRMGGIEVLVVGTRAGKSLRVDHFTARRVAGASVADGILRDDAGRLVLETSSGRIPLGNPPATLRNLIGGRVWIGGPLDTGPNSYGVIVPPR